MFSAPRLPLSRPLTCGRRLTSSAHAHNRSAHSSISALASSPRISLQPPACRSSRPRRMSSSPTHPQVRSTIHGEETVKEEELPWRTEPPYVRPDDGFRAEWEGSCHCGSIRYLLGRERPLSSKYCHCVDCQRMHAAPFQWAAIFHKSDFRFLKGAEGLNFYSPSLRRPLHDLPCKVYCETCHTPIMDEGRRMIMMFPELLKGIHSQRGKEAFKVGDHICWGGRVVGDGVFEGDGVRKWKGVDKQSELLDDGQGGRL